MDNSQPLPKQKFQGAGPNGAIPMVQQMPVVVENKKNHSGVIKTVVIVILSLVSLTFIGLFIWIYLEYANTEIKIEEEVSRAVAMAKDEQYTVDAERYEKERKWPYQTFSGPVDYGQLTFQYPKTWSAYVEADAANGGDFRAFFNPGQVNTVSKDTINALRVTILNDSFEKVVAKYQRDVEGNEPKLSVQTITIGDREKGIETTANKYTGTIPGTELNGLIVIFKIRDKTVVLQTDSMLFEEDFNTLLDTIVFNA